MKFVALLSGGKDSCYNIVHCTANGHELVAAASLRPPAGQGEIDSFMYQTVGQDAIELVAAALDVPLLRHTIHGAAIEQGGEYGNRAGKADGESEGVEGDETEDMFTLLSEVKDAYPDIQGVSVGAILSNYQRVRVDHVCQRLGLTPLCYLWQRDQRELMSEMIAAGVEAILIKVAGIGLKEQHLGKTLAQMETIFHNLNDKFGAHICGEGGEYETLTLDCPAFKKRITINETETIIHSDHSFATVAYLQIKDAVLEDKPQSTLPAPTVPPLLDPFATEIEQNLIEQESLSQESHLQAKDPAKYPPIDPQVTQKKDWIFISNVQCNIPDKGIPIENEVVSCFDTIKSFLGRSDLSLEPKHIVNTMLLLSDMDLFPRVNKAYAQYFGTSPPSRACVAVDLPEGTRVRVSCVAYKDHATSNPRSGLHVQGVSYWAPANIGPYSQAITAQYQTFVSGQIGLVPARMDFPSPPSFATEAALAFQHVERILDALKDESTSVLQSVIVWVAGEDKLELGRRAWNAYTQGSKRGDAQVPAVIVAAKSLPKGAMIEVQVLAHSNNPQSMDLDEDDNSNGELVKVSTNNSTGVDYEHKIRRIGDMSSFAIAFTNNTGLSNGLSALPLLLHHETLVVIVFHRPSIDNGGILFANQWDQANWGWLDGHQADVDKARPFQFGRLELTDDDDLLVGARSGDPYTIRVKLEWGWSRPQKLSRKPGGHLFDCPKIIGLLRKQEALAGNVTSVRLGEPISSDTVLETHTFRCKRNVPAMKFVFHYGSAGWLQANGIDVSGLPDSNSNKETIFIDENDSEPELLENELQLEELIVMDGPPMRGD